APDQSTPAKRTGWRFRASPLPCRVSSLRIPDARRDRVVRGAPRRGVPLRLPAGLVEARARVDRAVRAVEPNVALDVALLLLPAERGDRHRVEHALLGLRKAAAELAELLDERLALLLAGALWLLGHSLLLLGGSGRRFYPVARAPQPPLSERAAMALV